MKFYISWKTGRPVLVEALYGKDTPEESIRQHLGASRAKIERNRDRLDKAEQELSDMEALAAEYGVEYP